MFKSGQESHVSRVCPKGYEQKEPFRVTAIMQTLKEEAPSKSSPLSYAWGKVREHDNPSSTHNFIFTKLAIKLGFHDLRWEKL